MCMYRKVNCIRLNQGYLLNGKNRVQFVEEWSVSLKCKKTLRNL